MPPTPLPRPYRNVYVAASLGADVARLPLVIDVNEPGDIPERLRALGVDFEIKRIAPGDYVLGPVGIERKTLADFFNSLVRKRLFEQGERSARLLQP